MKKNIILLLSVLSVIITLTSCETYLDDYDGILNRDVSFICVKADASGKQNGRGWVDAYTTLAAAVSNAKSGDEIWICGDLSQENTQIVIDKDLTIIGGFDEEDNLESEKDPDSRSVVSWAVNDSMFLIPNPCKVTLKSLNLNNTNSSYRTIAITDGSISISNCIFDNNDSDFTGMHGGAIYAATNVKNVSIDNCTFQNCDSDNNGGALYIGVPVGKVVISDCIFRICKSDNLGGAVFGSNCTDLTINSCTFQQCETAISGGALRFWESAVEINNCVFDDNIANSTGGAISSEFSTLKIRNSSFNRNECLIDHWFYGGGAISAFNDTVIYIYSCTFNDNIAATNSGGGAVHASQDCDLYIYNSSFNTNRATEDGGALKLLGNRELYLENCTFSGNSAYGSGDSIFTTGILTTINCTIPVGTIDNNGTIE